MLDFKNLKDVATKQKQRSYLLAEQFLQNIFNRITFTKDDSFYPYIVKAEECDFETYEEYEDHFFGTSKGDFEFFLSAEYAYHMDFQGNLVFIIHPEEKEEDVLELLKEVLLNNGFTASESGHAFKRNIYER